VICVITTIVTFLTEKIVAVVITTVIVVAAVPTLIVAINGNTITITTATVASSTRKHDDEERARLILQVKTAGDSVVVNINHEEASCDSQVDQLAAVSTLSGSATKTALDNGKAKFHATAAPLLKEIKDDEDEFDHLNVITTETTQTFLVRISNVQVTAFGTDGSGVLITTCQTILVEIRQVIVIVVQKPGGGEGDDLKVKA
jgi:cell division protein FtsL